jgi:hypothetical protein
LKMFGLAAIAAVAAMAFVGASSASATVLCKTATVPCPEKYGAGTIIEGTATNATLTSNLATVVCGHSATKTEISNAGGAAATVTGKITALTFTSCFANNGAVPCTVSVQKLPYHAEVHWTVGANGILTAKTGGAGSPGANVVCAGLISCTFERTLFTLPVDGGNPASVTANKVSLERTAFGGTPLCGTEAFWDATYVSVGANTAIYVAKE